MTVGKLKKLLEGVDDMTDIFILIHIKPYEGGFRAPGEGITEESWNKIHIAKIEYDQFHSHIVLLTETLNI